MVALEPGRGVGDQGEAGGVGFGEAVEGEAGDAAHDVVLRDAGDAALGHAVAQPGFDLLHALLGALEAHRAPQFFGFAAVEAGCRHRESQQLFLEERDAEGATQNRFERRMRVLDGFAAGAPVQVGVHHLPDDRAGADDRDFHHQVVEVPGLHARQCRHLRAALDLEGAHRVGALDHGKGGGIIGREFREVDRDAFVLAREPDGVFERVQHAEAEQVDLDDAEVGAVVLVPLHHAATGHRRGFDRHDFVEAARSDHDAARVLAEMARQAAYAIDETEQAAHARRIGVDAALAQQRARFRRVLRAARAC